MIRAGDSIHNPVTGERIVFRQTSADTNGEAVVIETFVEPHGFVAAAHVHPSQEERFQVLRGTVGFKIGGKKQLAGILTEYDCLKLLTLGDAQHEAPYGKVKDFMTPAAEVQTIPPGMDIYYAAGLFVSAKFRRFPVVENGRIVGAITRFDIMRAVQRRLPTLVPYEFDAEDAVS